MASSSEPNGSSSAAQDGPPKIQWNWSGDDMNVNQSTGPKMSQLKSSRAYSVASAAADKSRREPLRANNPGSIPTAGGKSLGGVAREERERRKSRMSSSDAGMPPLDKEGSPDTSTQNNTLANTIPQRMNNGEGSSKLAEERPGSAPTPDVTVSNPEGQSETIQNSAPAAKENDPAPASKERRASRLDDMLGKLKLGGKKK